MGLQLGTRLVSFEIGAEKIRQRTAPRASSATPYRHAGDMTLNWKVVIDCADPHAQAAFWAAALGYVVEDNRHQRPLAKGVLWLPRISMTEERMFPVGWRHLSSACSWSARGSLA